MYHAYYCSREFLEPVLKVKKKKKTTPLSLNISFQLDTKRTCGYIRMSLSAFAANLFSECTPTNDNGGLCA